MLVPAPLYGSYSTVGRRAESWVRKLAAGEPPGPIGDEHVDSADRPGLFLLNDAPTILGRQHSFHCGLPMSHVKYASARGRVGQDVEDACFRLWLTEHWSLVGLLAPMNVTWFGHRPERFRPFLDAVTGAWSALYGEGERYSVGSDDGQDLWTVHTNLKFVLANMEVPTGVLRAPLPAGGPAELVAMTGAWDGVPVSDRPRP